MRTHGRALALVALVATAGGCIYDVSRFRNPADGSAQGDGTSNGDATGDATSEAGDAAHEGGADADASVEAGPDALADVMGELALDAEAGPDAVAETGTDAAVETGPDAPEMDAFEAGADALVEAGPDVPASEGGMCPVVDASGADAMGGADAGASCMPGHRRTCYPGTPGTSGTGVCRQGLEWCTAAGRWSGECFGAVTNGATDVCGNGQDDDCNGIPDDGCVSCMARAEACFPGNAATRGMGTCIEGTFTCTLVGGTSYEQCTTRSANALDICGDGRDDDCDGVVDDGCEDYVPTTYRLETNPPDLRFIEICADESDSVTPGEAGIALIPPPESPQTIPFPLRYYGRVVPSVLLVSVNGWLSFGEDASRHLSESLPSAPGGRINSASRPNNVVAPRWGDLVPSDPSVCFAVRGTAPSRVFIVEWPNTGDNNPDGFGSASIEVLIHEAPAGQNNVIEFAYADVDRDEGAPRGTTGIEDATGTVSTVFAGVINNSRALRFVPQTSCTR